MRVVSLTKSCAVQSCVQHGTVPREQIGKASLSPEEFLASHIFCPADDEGDARGVVKFLVS